MLVDTVTRGYTAVEEWLKSFREAEEWKVWEVGVICGESVKRCPYY